ncbi:MAG: sorbosone dehydrogenase family protein [Alphaproteobacteria bacterium]
MLMRAAIAFVVCIVAFDGWAQGNEQRVGQKFLFKPEDLPPPGATASVANSPQNIARPADAALRVPAGFRANIFADKLDHPRYLLALPNGDVLVAQSNEGKITLLRDSSKTGTANIATSFATGFSRPHGMTLHDGFLYIADTEAVWRIPYRTGDSTAQRKQEPVTPKDALGPGTGHWTRNVVISPDGKKLIVAIGSRGNIAEEAEPRATIQEFNLDGTGQRTYAAGLRNPVGTLFYPGTDDLYTVVNERDGLGDGLVPDYLTRVQRGAFYGWPYAYIGMNKQPGYAERKPDLVNRTVVPDVLFQSHSAPIGLAFYTGSQFPAEYRGDAFVALRGSWNSGQPTGYKIVRVRFKNGRPVGGYENFAVGFWNSGTDRAQVWGRPAGLAVAADGSLLIADDTGRSVWRISYRP